MQIGAEEFLTWTELFMAALVGLRRHIGALQAGYEDRIHTEDGWGAHIEGAAAEKAFAKLTNCYWSESVGTFKSGGDVGAIQVRSTKHLRGHLIVYADDNPDAIFVLMVGEAPHHHFAGGMRGAHAKQEKYLNANGSYWVPQSDLRSLEELRKQVV